MKKDIIIPCDCGGHHYLRFSKWDEETDLWQSLIQANVNGFWYRVKEAIKYVFGKENLYYHDVIIDRDELKKLKEWFADI